VDADDLSLNWRTEPLGSAVVSSPGISATACALYCATSDGRVLALSPQTGQVLWDYDLRDPQGEDWSTAQVRSSPAIVVNRLFIVAGDSSNRKLYCFGP